MILEISNFGRLQLADLFHDLDYRVGAEVGVAGGWYSSKIMERNPQLLMYGIDPWVPYRGYTDYTRTSTFAKLEDSAHNLLDKYPNYKFLKEFSMDALKHFQDNSLDFVYIDANHADPHVTQDITEWYKKVKPGGILAGHDYIRSAGNKISPPNNDTIKATQKYVKDNNLILFILGTKAIREGEIRDKVRSWLIKK